MGKPLRLTALRITYQVRSVMTGREGDRRIVKLMVAEIPAHHPRPVS